MSFFDHLEIYQRKKLLHIFSPKKNNFEDIYLAKINSFGPLNDDKKDIIFYNAYDPCFKFLNYSENEETKSEDFDYKKYYINWKNSGSHKENDYLNRKRKHPNLRETSEKIVKKEPSYKNNKTMIQRSTYISKVPTQKDLFKEKCYDNENKNVNKNQSTKKEEVEIHKTSIEPKMDNISPKSMNLIINKIINNNKYQSKVEIIIFDFLKDVHEKLKDKISKEGQNKINFNDLRSALKEKKLREILKIYDPKESEEANELLEKTPWDYINEQLSKNLSSGKKRKNKKIVRLIQEIGILKEEKEEKEEKETKEQGEINREISKNKEYDVNNINKNNSHKGDELFNELNSDSKNNIINQPNKDKESCSAHKSDEINVNKCNEIKKKYKKVNLFNVIKNFILDNFIEDFNKVSKKYKLTKVTKNSNINNIEKYKEFMNSNFDSFYNQCEKEETDENTEESEEAKNLISKTKLDYFNQLKENNKFSEFLTKNILDQVIKFERDKCRNKLNELFQTKNIEMLILLLDEIYVEEKKNHIRISDPDQFQTTLRGHNGFTILLTDNEFDNILERIEILEKIAKNPIGFLDNMKEEGIE